MKLQIADALQDLFIRAHFATPDPHLTAQTIPESALGDVTEEHVQACTFWSVQFGSLQVPQHSIVGGVQSGPRINAAKSDRQTGKNDGNQSFGEPLGGP